MEEAMRYIVISSASFMFLGIGTASFVAAWETIYTYVRKDDKNG